MSTSVIKIGDKVLVNQKIAELGNQCSEENGNVRRHLHFAVHKGTTVDERGYAPNMNALNN